MPNNEIDIIIPAYNVNDDDLFHCLAAIASQTMIDRIHVIIIDDASTKRPNYEEICDLLLYLKHDLILLDQNVGPGVARQIGLEKGVSDFIVFLDADDGWVQGSFEHLIKPMEENENVMMTCGLVKKNSDIDGGIQAFPIDTLHGKMYRRAFLEKYNITFNKDYSYMHEDKAFNTICYLLAQLDGNEVEHIEEVVYIYNQHENGLFRKNKNTTYFIESFIENALYAQNKILGLMGHSAPVDYNIISTMVQLYYYTMESFAEESDEFDLWYEQSIRYYNTLFKRTALIVPPEMIRTIYNIKTQSLYETHEMPFMPRASFIDFILSMRDGDEDEDTRIIVDKMTYGA